MLYQAERFVAPPCITNRSLHWVKVPVPSEEKADSASSTPAPRRRRSPYAKTRVTPSIRIFSEAAFPSSRAPPALGKEELIRKEGYAGWALARARRLKFQCNKNELKELHENFAQCYPRPQTCVRPTQPRLLEQRHDPCPFIPACCLRQGAPRVPIDRRGALVALCSAFWACVSYGGDKS